MDPTNLSTISPLDHLSQSIGKKVWILLKGEKEFEGILVGVDDHVNIVMADVTELVLDPLTGKSEEVGNVGELLLNGNNVTMIVEGGRL